MPNVSSTPKQLLAWCEDARCRGNAQTAVEGIVELVEWTFRERSGSGGGPPGVETSNTYFKFANPEQDAKCGTCGKNRAIGDQVRPKYESLSGHPQDELLRIEKWNPDRAAEVEALVDRLAEKLK